MIRQLTKCIREYKAPTIWTLVLILAEVAIDVIIPFETANLINEVKAGAELGGIVRVGLVLVLLAMISLVCGGERFSRTHGRHDFKVGGRKSFNGGANIVCVHNYHI